MSTWTLQHHGWATCTVSDNDAQAHALVSYVTGGPEYFLTAEPTVYRWIFHRRGTDVDIRLLEVPSARQPDDAGTVI
jgi:hypothetical protein